MDKVTVYINGAQVSSTIQLGKRNENLVTKLKIILPDMIGYGIAKTILTYRLLFMLPDWNAYVTSTLPLQEESYVEYIIESGILSTSGRGRMALQGFDGSEVIWESESWGTYVENNISTETPVPATIPGLVQELCDALDTAAVAAENANSAAQSANEAAESVTGITVNNISQDESKNISLDAGDLPAVDAEGNPSTIQARLSSHDSRLAAFAAGEGFSEGVIGPESTAFYAFSFAKKNLANPDMATAGKLLNEDGSLSNNATYNVTWLMPCVEGDMIVTSKGAGSGNTVRAYVFYGDDPANVIHGVSATGLPVYFTAPAGAKWLRTCYSASIHDYYQVEIVRSGYTATAFEPFTPVYKDSILIENRPRKKLLILGDSIAQGTKGAPLEAYDPIMVPFGSIIGERIHADVYNIAKGGRCIASNPEECAGVFDSLSELQASGDTGKKYLVYDAGDTTYDQYAYVDGAWTVVSIGYITSSSAAKEPIALCLSELPDISPDFIIFEPGTNDWRNSWTPIGAMSDRTAFTFYGALHVIFSALIAKYPGAKIFDITPIKRIQGDMTSLDSVNLNGKTLKEYGDIIKEVCDYYSIKVIDTYSESGLNPHLDDPRMPDKVHPNNAGHVAIADAVTPYIPVSAKYS